MSLAEDEIVKEIDATFGRPGGGRTSVATWQRRQLATTVAADAVAMALAWYLTYLVEVTLLGWDLDPTATAAYLAGGLLAVAGWVLVIGLRRGYDRRFIGISTEEYRRVVSGAFWFAAVTAVGAFYTGMGLSRSFTAVSVVGATALTVVLRTTIRTWMYRRRLAGRFTKKVVVVGRRRTAAALVCHFRDSPLAEMQVVGICVPPPEVTDVDHVDVDHVDADPIEGITVLGEPVDVWVKALAVGADAIAIADTDALSPSQVKTLSWHLEGRGVEVMVVPAVTDVAGPRISFRMASGLPLIYLDEPRFGVVARTLKATFDRVVAAAALLLAAPVMMVVAGVVRLTSPGPALFRQTRVGLDGATFRICKFRTMVVDAEERLGDIEHLNEHDGLLFKIRDDPRLTPVGRFLRRWSLDELPQLWNVLVGHMSLVGPRPPLPSEVERYDARIRRRLRVKPGLTGLWQVSGRSELSWDEGIRLDLEYIEQWSLMLDLVVLLRTALVVLRRHGAH